MRIPVWIAAVLLSLAVVMTACGSGGNTSFDTEPSPTPSPTPEPYILSVSSIPVEGARVVINPNTDQNGRYVPGTGRYMGDTPVHRILQLSDFGGVNSNCPINPTIVVTKAGYYGHTLAGGNCLPTDNTGAPINHLWEWTATLSPCPANVGPPYCGVVI